MMDAKVSGKLSPLTVTRAALIQAVGETTGFSNVVVRSVFECCLHEIEAALKTEREIKLHGFGAFVLRAKRSRPGRNPKTGERVAVSARDSVSFKPSRKLKSILRKAGAATVSGA